MYISVTDLSSPCCCLLPSSAILPMDEVEEENGEEIYDDILAGQEPPPPVPPSPRPPHVPIIVPDQNTFPQPLGTLSSSKCLKLLHYFSFSIYIYRVSCLCWIRSSNVPTSSSSCR